MYGQFKVWNCSSVVVRASDSRSRGRQFDSWWMQLPDSLGQLSLPSSGGSKSSTRLRIEIRTGARSLVSGSN